MRTPLLQTGRRRRLGGGGDDGGCGTSGGRRGGGIDITTVIQQSIQTDELSKLTTVQDSSEIRTRTGTEFTSEDNHFVLEIQL